MSLPRAQTPFLALLASAAVFPLTSAAQEEPAPDYRAEREIAITGEADEPPAVVYGAPYVPLLLSFDPPLMKDAVVTVQGADVRPHLLLADTLVITPTKSLAAQRSVPVAVPLRDGAVELTLAFSPPKRDTSVRIVRRAISTPRPVLAGGVVKEVLLLAASKVLDSGACASADGTTGTRPVRQGEDSSSHGTLVCGGGSLIYMSVTVLAKCAPATARLTRGEESAEVLLLAPHTVASSRLGTRWLVVARAPVGDGGGFTLELLAEDGAPCRSISVNLNPDSP